MRGPLSAKKAFRPDVSYSYVAKFYLGLVTGNRSAAVYLHRGKSTVLFNPQLHGTIFCLPNADPVTTHS